MIEDFIEKLLDSDLSLSEVESKFDTYADTDDYEIYKNFTAEDLRVRDQFYSYLLESDSFEQLKQRWTGRS